MKAKLPSFLDFFIFYALSSCTSASRATFTAMSLSRSFSVHLTPGVLYISTSLMPAYPLRLALNQTKYINLQSLYTKTLDFSLSLTC